ncbi:catechol 2,3-dioxygenase-like lactoylglutathione lyase family enzyme [Litoreibacter meonggei]|uniref:Catechol 2,3-dioxygenase-like lactoylglutathione lyase family enzyme n=1 Tax=Litoreibacter meonggei TaxID=1049199 RepID=A0A497VC19_9RHOB|nr:VOC family protein [Litoreibacter meonggei]RLJ41141.1 catechol 2,3-dioxygenase-like lactoylglutathione lyase family enzyme [Litoreibacter meonggei]
MTPTLTALDHFVLTVRDMSATVAFYTDVLGMQVREFQPEDGSVRTALYFGKQKINLHAAGAEYRPHSHVPTPGSADLCFLTEMPLEVWVSHFDGRSVEIEEGPVMRSGARGPIRSIYIRDPDRNLVEISVGAAQG